MARWGPLAPDSSVAWPRLSLSQAVEAAGGTRPHARLAWLCQAVGHLLCALGLAPGRHPLDGRVTVTSQERGTHNTGCWARATACPAGPGRSTGEGTACQRPAGTRSYPTSPLPQTLHPQSGMGRQRRDLSDLRHGSSCPHPPRTPCESRLRTGTPRAQGGAESQPEAGPAGKWGLPDCVPMCLERLGGRGVLCQMTLDLTRPQCTGFWAPGSRFQGETSRAGDRCRR